MQAEPQLLAQLPVLRALGVFDLFVLRDPALRALIDDELAAMWARHTVAPTRSLAAADR